LKDKSFYINNEDEDNDETGCDGGSFAERWASTGNKDSDVSNMKDIDDEIDCDDGSHNE
jgi:hypothetical protein